MPGTWTVVGGMNSAAYLGTETLTNVEDRRLISKGRSATATSLFIQLAPIVSKPNGNRVGGLLDDVMDFSGLGRPDHRQRQLRRRHDHRD